MGPKEEEFIKRLLATFEIEADEHLKTISSGIIDLEKDPPVDRVREIIEVIYRAAHSMKGAARSVNLADVEKLCHLMENVFAAWKNQEAPRGGEVFDALHKVLDCLRVRISPTETEPRYAGTSVESLVRLLEESVRPPGTPRFEQERENRTERSTLETKKTGEELKLSALAPVSDTIRVSSSRMSSLLLQAEELLGAKLWAGEHAKQVSMFTVVMQDWRRKWNVSAPEGQEELAALEHDFKTLAALAEQEQRRLAGMVDRLLDDMKRTLMLPFASLLEILPKLVRDLSRTQGKDVELVIDGGESEIDRRILDDMRDPLVHIIRNCIDHGIETPEERLKKGKTPKGSVRVTVAQKDGGHVELTISDDGAGIDSQGIKAAAIKTGAVSPNESVTIGENEAIALAFHSGVSTSPLITDVSGRGLGLAIVQEKVDKLGGILTVGSQRDQGTAINIVLPITIASFRGVLVRVGESTLVLPTINVDRVVQVTPDLIHTVENREMIRVNGRTVPLARLQDVLELPARRQVRENGAVSFAVIIRSSAAHIAFLADEILAEQEVMVKGLGSQLVRVRNISGIAVLGSGTTAPILNVHDMMKAAVRVAGGATQASTPRQDQIIRKTILLAEDSITARALLKSILEAAGYFVRTAVDGAEALSLVRTEAIDLIVSDVEMPRMNGFELTAKIRADKKLAEVPVVLVTALETREDRERGIEAGANAYIAKSSFDKSNLLDVVRRLL